MFITRQGEQHAYLYCAFQALMINPRDVVVTFVFDEIQIPRWCRVGFRAALAKRDYLAVGCRVTIVCLSCLARNVVVCECCQKRQ